MLNCNTCNIGKLPFPMHRFNAEYYFKSIHYRFLLGFHWNSFNATPGPLIGNAIRRTLKTYTRTKASAWHIKGGQQGVKSLSEIIIKLDV